MKNSAGKKSTANIIIYIEHTHYVLIHILRIISLQIIMYEIKYHRSPWLCAEVS